jgi:hypothetical protein
MSDWLWRNVIYGVFGAAVLAFAIAWVRGALERIAPTPEAVWKRMRRLLVRAIPAAPVPADDRFALLFAPLDGDGAKAEHTRRLLASFGGEHGFRRLRGETPVRIEGDDLDRAERAAEERARALGRAQGADLVIWGAVHQGGREIELWLTPVHGVGAGKPTLIEGGAAASGVADAIAARLAALALAQLPEDDARQRFLDASLEHVLARVETLLAAPPAALAARDRAGLERARADALVRLGADLGDVARLRAGLAAFEALHAAAAPAERPELAKRAGEAAAALAVLTADRALLDAAEARLAEAARGYGHAGGDRLAEVQDALGRARYWRAAWDSDPAALEEAAEAVRDAAEGFAAAGLAERAADARVSQALLHAMQLGRRGDPAGMEAAASRLHEALGADPARAQPRRRALAGMMLAWIEAMLAQERGDPEALEAAARRAAAALASIPKQRAPIAWAQARAMQAAAEAARASYRGDVEGLAEARRGLDEALAVVPRERAPAFFAALRVDRARISLALADLAGDPEAADAARTEAEAAAADVAEVARPDRLDAALLVARARALVGQLRGEPAALEGAAAACAAIAEKAGAIGILPLRINAALAAATFAAAAAGMRGDRAAMGEAADRLTLLADEVPVATRPAEHARVAAARAGILLDRARTSTPDEARHAWSEAHEALEAVLAATPADSMPLGRAWLALSAAEAAMRLATPETLDKAAASVIEHARAVERFGQMAQAANATLLRAEAMLIRADLAADAVRAAEAGRVFRSAFETIPRRHVPLRLRAAIGQAEAALRTLGPGRAARGTAEAAAMLDALLAETPGLPPQPLAIGRLTAGTGFVAAGHATGDRSTVEKGLARLREAAGEAAMPAAFRAEVSARLAGALGAVREMAPSLVAPDEIATRLREAGDFAEAAGHPDKAAELRRMAGDATT